MTILFFAAAQLFAIIFAAVVIAWTRPQWLQSIAAMLVRIAAASTAARNAFQKQAIVSEPAKPAALTVSDDPFFADVTSALVNLGTTPAAAKAATRKAIIKTEVDPTEHNFDSIFKLALQFAR